VGRRHVSQFFHLGQQSVVNNPDTTQTAGKHSFEPNRGHFIDGLQTAVLGIRQLLQATINRLSMVVDSPLRLLPMVIDFHNALTYRLSNPIDTAPRQLGLALQIKQTIFEARRSEIGDKNLHDTTSSA